MKELSIEEKAKRYDEAIKKVNDYYEGKTKLYSNVDKTLDCLFPGLKESEDERIRKELIEHIKANKEVGFVLFQKFSPDDVIAWLERQKVTDEEIIFRPVVGTDIRIAAKQALKKIDIGKKVVLAFNGAYILVNGKTVGEIDSEYDAWLKKQSDINETINRDEFAQGVLRGAAINLITWIDYNTAKGNMCLSNMECRVIEDALVNGDWDKIYAYIKRKLEKQSESKFKQCIQEGDKIVANDDGTHFNVSQLERTANKVAESKKTAKEFLKSAKIMDEDNKLADEYKLEKQGEQEEPQVYETEDGEIITYSETDGYKVVEPKFKVGDWIVREYTKDIITINQVVDIKRIDDEHFGYTLDDETYFSGSWESSYHLWTIKDAKDGDVLVGNERSTILMFRGIGNTEWNDVIDYHCYYDCYWGRFIVQKDLGYWGNTENKQLMPATKEQSDLLFQKMKEAGYEWNADKKELKKIDSYCQKNCKGYQETGRCFVDGECQAKKDSESTWSEEDEERIREIIEYLNELYDKYRFDLNELNDKEHWLKSLKEKLHPQWKPSEEQIQALEYQVNSTYKGSWQYKASKELLEQIKKL